MGEVDFEAVGRPRGSGHDPGYVRHHAPVRWAVLLALFGEGPKHGLRMTHESAADPRGVFLGPGTLYPALRRRSSGAPWGRS